MVATKEIHLGETWVFTGTARDSAGAPLNIAGATIDFRLAKDTVLLVNTSTTDGGVTIKSNLLGTYEVIVPPKAQLAFTSGPAQYETRITLSNSVVTIQSTGRIMILPSLFKQFT